MHTLILVCLFAFDGDLPWLHNYQTHTYPLTSSEKAELKVFGEEWGDELCAHQIVTHGAFQESWIE